MQKQKKTKNRNATSNKKKKKENKTHTLTSKMGNKRTKSEAAVVLKIKVNSERFDSRKRFSVRKCEVKKK